MFSARHVENGNNLLRARAPLVREQNPDALLMYNTSFIVKVIVPHRVEPLCDSAEYVATALTSGKTIPKPSNRSLFAAKVLKIGPLQVAKFLFRAQRLEIALRSWTGSLANQIC